MKCSCQNLAQNRCCSHQPHVNLLTLLADTRSPRRTASIICSHAPHKSLNALSKVLTQSLSTRLMHPGWTRKAASACDAPSQLPKVPKWGDVCAQQQMMAKAMPESFKSNDADDS
ncbi:hypothetical protein KP509_27G014500 [Ceratopteris richardii]|uniref:Uncharacterized protein n=1 Tax=Ceratopteris richardii TaxID=49495 RepID=A0A8T2RGH1_CERRI|nr:hypothetical protein KP509_27G014500 [Ceratopteris richardii]